jgi:hypothetical protein
LFVVCCLLFVVCCLLFVVCCLLFVVCCLLFVVFCLLVVVCDLQFVFWQPSFGAQSVLQADGLYLTCGLGFGFLGSVSGV